MQWLLSADYVTSYAAGSIVLVCRFRVISPLSLPLNTVRQKKNHNFIGTDILFNTFSIKVF